jgi:hypothetical protein
MSLREAVTHRPTDDFVPVTLAMSRILLGGSEE